MKTLEEIIIEQVNLYNKTLDEPVDLSCGEASVLFGKGSNLDSVDFVSLILDIEQAVEEETGVHVILSDSKALSQKNSPFRTVGTLVEYVKQNMES